jgi:shikimate dehydrogenase
MTETPQRSRLAVLGSPVAHSASPALHRAAYAVLGLDWRYESVDVTSAGLADFVTTRDASWRGLSLTMPLKRDVLPLLSEVDPLVSATGSANTVLFGSDGRLAGFNTDVDGIVGAFAARGHDRLGVVQILGGGATAASAIAAAARLSAETVFVSMRSPERADDLRLVGRESGVDVVIGALSDAGALEARPDAVISTLPNGAQVEVRFPPETIARAVLFDVAYHPWPSALASVWGGDVIGGLEMLVVQALSQVRIFVGGDPRAVLDDEPTVLAAMYAAVGL